MKKTLPNSDFTADELQAIRDDVFQNYSPALRNADTFIKKYNLSRQRINDIYWEEAGKNGIVKPIKKSYPETIRFTAEAGTNDRLKQVAHGERITRPELLRKIVEDYLKGEDQ